MPPDHDHIEDAPSGMLIIYLLAARLVGIALIGTCLVGWLML